MNNRIKIPLLLLALSLTGCNTVYLYETEKVSLTLEGRPDPSSPVSGNLGLKQRVVLIVPPTSDGNSEITREVLAATEASKIANQKAAVADAEFVSATDGERTAKQVAKTAADADASAARAKLNATIADAVLKERRGDSLSAISSFRFNLQPADASTPWYDIRSRVTIDSAFITGLPAIQLDKTQAGDAIGALSGQSSTRFGGAHIAGFNVLYTGLIESNDNKTLVESLDGLVDLLPSTYPVSLYAVKDGTVTADPVAGTSVPAKTFVDVNNYHTYLILCIKNDSDIIDQINQNKLKLGGVALTKDSDFYKQRLVDIDTINQKLKDFEDRFSASTAMQKFYAYSIGK